MRLFKTLKHFFLPGTSNNHRAKILHPSSFIAIKIILIVFQLGIFIAPRTPFNKILGYAANISPSEVIRLTNEKRVQAGLSPLQENGSLSQAAQAKGADMLVKGYWAHVAPDGTQPWFFFANAGYKYRFAGENLARDFTNPNSTVDAWMASASHRENLLSPNYKEIGIGVVEGNLAGADTTIVVQFFGTRYGDAVPAPIAQAPAITALATPTVVATLIPTPTPTNLVSPSPTTINTPAPTVIELTTITQQSVRRFGGDPARSSQGLD